MDRIETLKRGFCQCDESVCLAAEDAQVGLGNWRI